MNLDSAHPDLKRTARRGPTQADRFDRLPPHSPEAEQGVLACCLVSPNECVPECLAKFGDGSGDVMYDLRHKVIFAALAEMYDARTGIDVITLQQRLKNAGKLDEVGGIAYLSVLPDTIPSAANLPYYLAIVWEKYLLRRTIQVCTEIVGKAYEHQGAVDQLLDEVERDILHVAERRTHGQSSLPLRPFIHKAVETIERCHDGKGKLRGLSYGFVDLDKMTWGMTPGQMIIIAGRPSMGKTSLVLNIADHVGVVDQIAVGVFSLETTGENLAMRMLCARSRISMNNIRDGFLVERDFPKITSSAGKLAGAPIYIDDSCGLSILELRARARRMMQQFGVKLFVVDYLQLLRSTNRRADSRQQEIADISGGIKALAKELSLPVIVLSQLNRLLDREKSRKPALADLRESGSLEQDADVVGMLYRPSDAGEGSPDRDSVPVNLFIAKQKDGPTGDIPFTFLRNYTRFEPRSKVSDADVPEQEALNYRNPYTE
jgi:replicative DNA helicase